ncbi:hypothetical protein H2200_000987 [Cladophialophora chaetospira]|uniref:Transcription factor domain-containing protein n=1 Tax=Cladophialophora chaetospira TaxID=386627 RepID=A0AA38XPV8_9EURO|nr:hypothetical protein H2200_000987 [Cladophialophora chaetospira]
MADDHAEDARRQNGEKKKPLVVSGFEFVLMGSKGALNKKGISQIRAHTTRELHRTRRESGQAQTLERRRRNRPGNILFGSQTDPFHVLPQLPFENQMPGVLDEVKHNVFHVYNQKTMKQIMWPQITKNGTFFTAMMLMGSVHLDGLTTRSSSATTTALKVETMHRVRESMQDASRPAIITSIAAIAILATSAENWKVQKNVRARSLQTLCQPLAASNFIRLHFYRDSELTKWLDVMHRNAYDVLIREATRLNMFEDSRFCKDVLKIITVIAAARRCRIPTSGLAPLADSRTLLKEYEHVFNDRWRSRTAPDPELYSPLYDGREDSNEDPFPFVSQEYLRVLLQMMQSVVKIWLRQRTSSVTQPTPADSLMLNSLYQRIFSMPSSEVSNLPCSNDYVYEACRLASVLLIRSVYSNRHWKYVAAGTSILSKIREALQNTALDGLWEKNIGLLYFVVLIFHSAAFGTPDYIYGHVLQGRIHFELTYSHNDWHGALRPMMALNDLMPNDYDCGTKNPSELELMDGYSTILADMQSTVGSSLPILLSDTDTESPD